MRIQRISDVATSPSIADLVSEVQRSTACCEKFTMLSVKTILTKVGSKQIKREVLPYINSKINWYQILNHSYFSTLLRVGGTSQNITYL